MTLPSFFSSAVRSRTRMGATLLSLLFILSYVLVACGGGTAQSQKTTVLTVGSLPWNSQNFNPFYGITGNVNPGTTGMIYETLLYMNILKGGAVTPWLASSYQFSKDATTLTFHLRPNVQWSDGQPFSSADVVFTVDLLKQYPALDINGLWNYLKTVTAPDSSTVVVTLKQPFSPLLWYLGGQTYIVPKHLWSSVSDPVKYTNANPVGTGPFTLKSFSPQLIDLVKNPRFWQASKLQVTEERILSFNTFNSMELSIIRGDIDLGPLYVSGIQQTFVQRDPTHNHIFYPPTVVVSLVPNLAKYPLNLLPVRQAISLAIDRNQLEKVGEDNNASVAHPTGLILPSQQTYLSPAYANASFTVDTNKANQLLQSAGFTKGSDGIYADKNGKKLALSITITSAIPAWVTEAQIIVSNLQAIGIQLTVNAPAGGTYFNDMQLGNYDLGYQYGTGGPTPYFLFNTLLNSSQTAPIGKSAASDWERWNDATSNQLLNQFASTTDSNVQIRAMQGLEKIMVEQLPVLPLYNEPIFGAYSTTHFTGWPDTNNSYARAAPFEGPDNEVVVLNLHPVG